MKLLLSAPRRATSSRWICHSCRGIKTLSNSNTAADLGAQGPARTRFAPSPTGYLHLGSLRTALFNYMVAKSTGGQFLLRIEDTDQKRTIPDAEQRLFDDLRWAGLEWDEGPGLDTTNGGPHGPYRQSERTAIYREATEKLLESGHGYRCFCSPERLYTLAQHRSSLGLPPDYDRTCTHIPKEESDDRASKGESHVVRLKVPDKYPVFHDLVYGVVRQRNELTTKPRVQVTPKGSFDDPILMKSDGFPTYHLANVVDDHLMKITHVIRGSEWISSTPKHLAIYEAFGWHPPAFAHVGLLLDKNRQKLSKRNASIDVSHYRNQGIFPETLTNFVALLGWSHNHRKDIMSLADLVERASLKFTRGDSIVAFEKLHFLQKRHAARYASLTPISNAQGLVNDLSSSANPLHDLDHLAVQPIVELAAKRAANEDFTFYTSISDKPAYMKWLLYADAHNYVSPTEFINRNIYFFVSPSKKPLQSSIPSLKFHNVPLSIPHQPSHEIFSKLILSITQIPDDEFNTSSIRQRVQWIIKQGTSHSLAEASMSTGMFGEVEGNEEGGLEKRVQKAWNSIVHAYLRWALLGGKTGPDSAESMAILGKDEVARRLGRAEEVMMLPVMDDRQARGGETSTPGEG